MKKTKPHLTINQYHNNLSGVNLAICQRLHEIITRTLIGGENKVWHGHPVWFLGGNPIVGYDKLKNCIRLLFWSGQSFDETGLSPEGSFKAAEKRYTKIEEIDESELTRWLQKSLHIQWDYKNIVKNRGVLNKL